MDDTELSTIRHDVFHKLIRTRANVCLNLWLKGFKVNQGSHTIYIEFAEFSSELREKWVVHGQNEVEWILLSTRNLLAELDFVMFQEEAVIFGKRCFAGALLTIVYVY